MKTEIKNRILGTAMAGIMAAGLSMAITPVFADDAPADGATPPAAKAHKDGCKGKAGCKGKKHHKGKKKAADAPAADAPTKTE